MHCNKCQGKVFTEGVFSSGETPNWLELYCILCGKRWMLEISGNARYGGLVKRILRHNRLSEHANLS